MSARLASFRGPSTPSSSPVKQAQSPRSTQSAKQIEQTYHRKLRASLQELRQVCWTWDDLVRKDGLKAVRELIDARTDLECVSLSLMVLVKKEGDDGAQSSEPFSNMLALVPDGEQPRSRLVSSKLSYMDERIAAIDLVISKLVRLSFSPLTSLVLLTPHHLRKSNSRR
jgi:hypothetical protein